jgi:carbon-monoxide dehydrogenase medium subunit
MPGNAQANRRSYSRGHFTREGVMKPVAFDYERPHSLAAATALLRQQPEAKILAGGQTLGPMLNLRLIRPALLVDITGIAELSRVESSENAVLLGACITHAAIEDGRIDDPAHGLLTRVARSIAYRAVRNRGTVGGSLSHADPAADWLSCLLALDADVLIAGHGRQRWVGLPAFVTGALATALEGDEILVAVRIPRLSAKGRAGYAKICRKTGEFAEAIGVVVADPEKGFIRLVAGALSGPPCILDGASLGLSGLDQRFAPLAVEKALTKAGLGEDAYAMRLHLTALTRAFEQAQSP